MLRNLLFSVLSFVAIIHLHAQDLPSALQSFADELTIVETGKFSYDQTIAFDEDKPYNLRIQVSKEGKKGSEEVQYAVNLADLNTRLISWKAKGDVMEVKMQTKKRQKFIEVLKDGELDNYVSELVLYATSADNARAMEEKLIQCIKLAELLFSAELEISGYQAGVSWLLDNVQAVQAKKDDTNQELIKLEDKENLFLFRTEIGDKEELFRFNISDLRVPSVRMDVKGQEVSVNVKTEKSLKYIGVTKDGERSNFIDEVKILVGSIEEGRIMSDVLSKTIGFSQEDDQAVATQIATFEEGLQETQALLGKAMAKGGDVSQQLKNGCNATLQKNGKESEQYIFHFGDLNPKDISIKVSGKYLSVQAKTSNKESLIQYYKEGELSKYLSVVSLDVDEIEQAKQLQQVLADLIPLCVESRTYTYPTSGTTDELANWLISNTSSFENASKEYQQVLEKMDNDPCKLAFTQTTSTEKKSSTEVFEFNLVDIDPRDIKYAIRGKDFAVAVEATGNKKYIKHYKDDKVDDYVGSFKIYLDDMELARNMRASLEGLARGCK